MNPTLEKPPAAVDDLTVTGPWKFDRMVADVFADMLARSIPQYELMRELVAELAVTFAQRDTWIVDLGTSRGDALDKLVRFLGATNRYLGVEVSEPMIERARERFAGYIQTGLVDIRALDLRTDYPRVNASVTQAVLTLQFVPIEYRQAIVQSAYDATAVGGAFILVEKVLGAGAKLDALFVKHYLERKRQNGYTDEQIERKRLSLEGVLVPITAQWNELLLRNAGFTDIDCFWRCLNFAAWVAVKR